LLVFRRIKALKTPKCQQNLVRASHARTTRDESDITLTVHANALGARSIALVTNKKA